MKNSFWSGTSTWFILDGLGFGVVRLLGNKLAELNRQGPPETELTLYRCSGSLTGVVDKGLDGRRLAGSAGEGFGLIKVLIGSLSVIAQYYSLPRVLNIHSKVIN